MMQRAPAGLCNDMSRSGKSRWISESEQTGPGKVNKIVSTEPKGNREFSDSFGNITTSNHCQELFQCRSLSEVLSGSVSALHY